MLNNSLVRLVTVLPLGALSGIYFASGVVLLGLFGVHFLGNGASCGVTGCHLQLTDANQLVDLELCRNGAGVPAAAKRC